MYFGEKEKWYTGKKPGKCARAAQGEKRTNAAKTYCTKAQGTHLHSSTKQGRQVSYAQETRPV